MSKSPRRYLVLCCAFAAGVLLPGCETPPADRVVLEPVSRAMPPFTSDAYDISNVSTMPVAMVRVPPRYPFDLRRAGAQGEAQVLFVVGTDGMVRDAVTIRANDRRFAAAAEAAVSQWRFRPATVDGRPVNCRMMVPIIFTLN